MDRQAELIRAADFIPPSLCLAVGHLLSLLYDARNRQIVWLRDDNCIRFDRTPTFERQTDRPTDMSHEHAYSICRAYRPAVIYVTEI